MGDRVQVPARGEDDAAARHHGEHRAHRSRHAVRAARAGVRRRFDRRARDAAQPGRGRAQGRARRRHRDRAQGRRRHPRGRRARCSPSAKRGARKWKFPTDARCAAQPLVRLEGEADTRCVNVDCPAQRVQRIVFFAGRSAMDIEGLGEERVTPVRRSRAARRRRPTSTRSPSSSCVPLERIGERSAQLLVAAIDASRVATAGEAARRARHPPRRARPRRWRSPASSATSTRIAGAADEELAAVDRRRRRHRRERAARSSPSTRNRELVEKLRAAGVNFTGPRSRPRRAATARRSRA